MPTKHTKSQKIVKGCAPLPWPVLGSSQCWLRCLCWQSQAPGAVHKTRMKGHPPGCPALVSSSRRDSTTQNPIRWQRVKKKKVYHHSNFSVSFSAGFNYTAIPVFFFLCWGTYTRMTKNSNAIFISADQQIWWLSRRLLYWSDDNDTFHSLLTITMAFQMPVWSMTQGRML